MYVGNLSWRLDDSRLAQLFSEHGTVLFAKVMRDLQTGRSKGFGFVAMASHEEREDAIAALNGQILEGLVLRVSVAKEPDVTVSKAVPGDARVESPPPRHVVGPSFRLHVNNLSSNVDDSRLAQMFSQHGKVVYAKVIRDFKSGRSKGFGFVEMLSRGEMDSAITALHGQSLEGRVMRVSAAEVPGMTVSKAAPGVESSPPRHVVGPSFRLHVHNLSLNMDDSRLAQMFSRHGRVAYAKVVRDIHSERSKGFGFVGFGFVEMASQEDMDNAITALHGQSLEGRVIRVSAAEEQSPS
ncbi:28 kDa ribonucleoprotein, chloroplastic [Triticum urartu]|uniref:28 kDa ribonucleoprotein, chloroplastic n=1 Tax=Triticum urartu TaxID=4572 RepID=M7ZI70_TRIUA|nr:28 kDa ribonucleoprotein, chloroplastic [Triticum urartu]